MVRVKRKDLYHLLSETQRAVPPPSGPTVFHASIRASEKLLEAAVMVDGLLNLMIFLSHQTSK
jgi:hypothetical protein